MQLQHLYNDHQAIKTADEKTVKHNEIKDYLI